MSLESSFNRIRRDIGIKKCVIIDGNVGDVYLNDKHKIVQIRDMLTDMLTEMRYDSIFHWDRIEGLSGDIRSLDVVDNVEVKGDTYDFDVETDVPQEPKQNPFKDPSEIFNVIFRNLASTNKRVAFVLNWADLIFSPNNQFSEEEKQNLVLLGKSIRERKINHLNPEVNESTIIMIGQKISMFPIAFYQNNPEVSTITLSRPDRLEREKMLVKLEPAFNIALKPGETLITADKKNEYVDMLDDFTNREIIQLSKLSRKESRMSFDKLYYLFKYGEKDNPWEKLDYKELSRLKETLGARVVGQDQAIEKIQKVIVKAYMGLTGLHKSSSKAMPKGVLFFVGPTGVGKTELSKALAKFLFGDDQACLRFDMSEYAQENSDQKLIGAPPGYVGYEEGGQLTNAVREKPFSVILFDEIEKAAKFNPRILDVFLQILEDGRLTDSKGETVHFSETIIIFTSNLGASEVMPQADTEAVGKEFIRIVKNYFDHEIKRPELLGRIGYSNIVPFNFINDREFMVRIAKSKLVPVRQGIAEKYRLDIGFEDELQVIDHILGGADVSTKGGRDILNAINDHLLDSLSMFLFEHKQDLPFLKGSTVMIKVGKKGLEFEFQNE